MAVDDGIARVVLHYQAAVRKKLRGFLGDSIGWQGSERNSATRRNYRGRRLLRPQGLRQPNSQQQ
jgi:hypothetical protein